MTPGQILRINMISIACVITLLTGFVLMRDSLDVVSALEQDSTNDTVMACKKGAIRYQGFAPVDRIMGRGNFVCTEWDMEHRYMVLPRSPHFAQQTAEGGPSAQ